MGNEVCLFISALAHPYGSGWGWGQGLVQIIHVLSRIWLSAQSSVEHSAVADDQGGS